MPESFVYWVGESVHTLIAQLQPTSRLEVRKVGDQAFLTVVTPGQTTANSPINDSHICPPQCP